MPKSKEMTHLRVRVRPQLLARLKKASKGSGRTLTGEIVTRLEESFAREPALADLASQVGSMREDLAKTEDLAKNLAELVMRTPSLIGWQPVLAPFLKNEEEEKK
jgi:hypothetical protein